MGTARNLENRHLFGGNRVTCILMWEFHFVVSFLWGTLLLPSLPTQVPTDCFGIIHNFNEIIKMRLMKIFIESCYMSALLST